MLVFVFFFLLGFVKSKMMLRCEIQHEAAISLTFLESFVLGRRKK